MAAGPGGALQCDSPARELSLSAHQGSNPIHGDRVKPEESAGKRGEPRLHVAVLRGANEC